MRVPLSSPLSHDQKQFFETFGFLVFEGFFSADELETIHREGASQIWGENGQMGI